MQKKGSKKSSQKTSRTRTKSVKGGIASKKTVVGKSKTKANSMASNRFVNDLLVRGEAARPDAEGKLPNEATHAVTKENEDGTVEVKRARYKYY
jgi:hypothetical protein